MDRVVFSAICASSSVKCVVCSRVRSAVTGLVFEGRCERERRGLDEGVVCERTRVCGVLCDEGCTRLAATAVLACVRVGCAKSWSREYTRVVAPLLEVVRRNSVVGEFSGIKT